MNPKFFPAQTCHSRLKFCVTIESSEPEQSARWSHDLGSVDSCTAPSPVAVALVPAGGDCALDWLCQSTPVVPAASSPEQTASIVRSELRDTCFQAFAVGGVGATVLTRTDFAHDVCVNGTKVVEPSALDSAAVCGTATGTQTAEGVFYATGALPSLSPRQWLVLGGLLALVAVFAGRWRRPAARWRG